MDCEKWQTAREEWSGVPLVISYLVNKVAVVRCARCVVSGQWSVSLWCAWWRGVAVGGAVVQRSAAGWGGLRRSWDANYVQQISSSLPGELSMYVCTPAISN